MTLTKQISLDVAYLFEARLSQAEVKSVLKSAGTLAADFNPGPEDAKSVSFADEFVDKLVAGAKEVEIKDQAELEQLEQELHDSLMQMTSDDPAILKLIDNIQAGDDVVLSLALIKAIEYASETEQVDDEEMAELIYRANQAILNFDTPSIPIEDTAESINLSDLAEEVLTESLPVLGYLTRIPGMLKTISDLDKTRRKYSKIDKEGDRNDGWLTKKAKKGVKAYKNMPSTQIRNVKSHVEGDLTSVDFESLANDWELDGSSLESEDLIRILKNNGFDNKQIRKAFDNAGVQLSTRKRDDRIVRLSRLIYKHGMQDMLLRHLQRSYGINESIRINEGVLTDKAIKQIFIDVLKQQDNIEKNMSPGKLMDRVEDWARDIKRADTTNEKTILAKEIVNVMANRKNHPDHASMIAAIEKIIRSSKIDPKFMNRALQNLRMGAVMEHTDYLTASYLLSESDLSWDSLSLKPVILEDKVVRLDYVLAGTTVLLEDIFTDALRYQFIHQQLK